MLVNIVGGATQPASTKAGDDGGEIGLKDIAKLIQNQSIQLVALHAKVDKSLAGVSQINTRLDTLEGKMDSANGKISNLENKVDDVESELLVMRAESTARKEEVDKFRAMSRYDPTQQIQIQMTKTKIKFSPKSLPAPGGILRECADLFTQ